MTFLKKSAAIVAICAVFLVAVYLLSTHKTPYRVSQVLGGDHPTTRAYEDYLSKYNDENSVLYLIQTQRNLLEGTLAFELDRALTEKLEQTHGLKTVQSLSRTQYLTRQNNETHLRRFFENGLLRPEAKKHLTQSSLWKNSFVSLDHSSLLVTTDLRTSLNAEDEQKLVQKLIGYGKQLEQSFPEIKVHLLGTKVAAYYFNEELKKQQWVVTPISGLIIAMFLFLLFRSVRVVFLCLFTLSFAFAINTVLILWIEKGLNPYTHFALVFVSVVATADLVHFFSAYLAHTHGSLNERLQQTFKRIIKPCFFTAFTTWIGFASICVTDITAISRFGFYASTGIIICFLLTFFILPRLISLFQIKLDTHLNPTPASTRTYLVSGLKRKSRLILWVTAILCATSLGFSTQIKIDDNLYFKFVDSHPLTKSVRAFGEQFKFTGAVDVLVKVTEAELLKENFQSRLKNSLQEVSMESNIVHTRSIADYLDHIRNVMNGSVQADDFSQDENRMHLFQLIKRAGLLAGVWSSKHNEIKISVRLKDISSSATLASLAKIKAAFEKNNLNASISGFTAVRVEMLHEIIWGFIVSFGIDLLVIFLSFVFLLRSWRWGVLAMIPNLVPICILMGALGVTGILVEDTVILTISILLGIAVDDTIHFTHGILENQKQGISIEQSIEGSFQQNWMSILGTTLIFVLTAPCTLLTDFLVFSKMTFFFTSAMVLALLTELVVMPVLVLNLLDKRKSYSAQSEAMSPKLLN